MYKWLALVFSIFSTVNLLQSDIVGQATSACLHGALRSHRACQAMGVTHPPYPKNSGEFAEISAELLSNRASWIQGSDNEWHKLGAIGTIYRWTKLGVSFEGRKRLADGTDGPDEIFHVCRGTPCTYQGGAKSSNKKGLPVTHVTAFAFSDGEHPRNVPQGAVMLPPVGHVAVWSWKLVLGVVIVAVGLLTRLQEALSSMNLRTLVTGFFRKASSFFWDQSISLVFSAEIGLVEGFSESLWEQHPPWFPWVVRVVVYTTIGVQLDLPQRLYHRVRLWWAGKQVGPGRPSSGLSCKSEPPSDTDDCSCNAHIVKMDLEGTCRSLSDKGCTSEGVESVQLVHDDWASSHLPESDRVSGLFMCGPHAMAYHTLRGHKICRRKGCCGLGTLGPDGLFYCPLHMSSAVTPPPPVAKVKFEDLKEDQAPNPVGLESFPDAVLTALISNVDPDGVVDEKDLVDILTDQYGGKSSEKRLEGQGVETIGEDER